MFFIYLALLAASVALSFVLRPKSPDGPTAAKFDEYEMPTCQQGTPYAVIFGTPPRFKGFMVLWYGAYYVKKIKQSSGFGSSTTVGYKYALGVLLGLAHGNVDGVLQMWCEDTCVWPVYDDPDTFASEGQTYVYLNAMNVLGGKLGGGGIRGDVDIMYGDSDQDQNAYLISQLSETVPALRGITTVLFRSFYWGESPKLPEIAFTLRRLDKQHDGTAQWYGTKSTVNIHDLNVVHAIRELMISDIIGLGISSDVIDSTSFQAAADQCYVDEIGISYKYTPGDEMASDLIADFENMMDGVLYYDYLTGLYKIQMIRDDYVEAELDEYDDDDFDIVSLTRPTYYDTPYKTIVNYVDRATCKRVPASDSDAALDAIQDNRAAVQEFDFPYIADADLATKIATRKQQHVVKMPMALTLVAKRTMYDVHRGKAFKISHQKLTAAGVLSLVVRAMAIRFGTLEEGTIEIDAVQDVFSEPIVSSASNPSSSWTPPVENADPIDYETNIVTFEELTITTNNEVVA